MPKKDKPNSSTSKPEEVGIPEVKPPGSSKKELLKDVDFSVIDHHALKATNSLLKESFWDLTKYLSDDDAWEDDLVKVRVIFRWITSYNVKKMKIEETPPPNTPLEYFSKIQSGFGNHAQLFYIMCQLFDIPCVVVDGMTKSKMYTVGDPVNHEEMAAQWNAVYVRDEWRLIDLFWAIECVEVDSGKDDDFDENGDFLDQDSVDDQNEDNDDVMSKASFIRYHHNEEVDEQYFLTDPRQLIWTHLPDDSKWQLMKTPMSEKDWEEQLYVRERSHEMEISIKRNLYGKQIVQAKEGKADIILWFPEKKGESYEFKHSFRRTDRSEGKKPIDKILNRFTIFDHIHDRIHFKCMLPVAGRFYLDIYGRDKQSKELGEFDLLCTYVIVSTTPDKEPDPLPDYPRIGWGECARSRKLNLIPITHKEAFITTEDGILDIRMQGSDKLKLKIKMKSVIIDEVNLVKYVMMHWHAGEYLIQTRLPKPGKYALKLYGFLEPNATEMVNVYNYLITCTGRGVKNYPFPCFSQDQLGEDPNAYKIWVRGFQTQASFIEAKEGHTKLEFEAKDGIQLQCELNTNNPVAAERMRVVTKEDRSHQLYFLDLPIEGEYSFNLYAYKKNSSQRLHNAFTYLIHSTGRPIEKGQTNTSKGNTNRNFWRDSNEITTETVETADDEVIFPVPRCMDNLIAFLAKRKSDEPPTSKSVERFTEKDIELYRVKVPEVGEYVFTIYEKKDVGFMKSRARYLIRKVENEDEDNDDDVTETQDFLEVLRIIRDERKKEGKSVKEAEKQLQSNRKIQLNQPKASERIALSQNLKSAINSRRPALIKRALNEYKYLKPSQGDDLLVEGSRLLRKLEAQEALIRAYEDQDLKELDKAIVKARSINDPSMKQPLTLASRLRDRLAAKNNLKDMILNADIRTIYELRKLVHPPDGVHQTIKAALMLLDCPRQEVENWNKCMALLGNRGQDGLRYKMSELNPDDVSRKNALDAKITIEPYTEEQLRYISPGAAAFFNWTEQVIKEVEARGGVLKKKPPKPKTPPPPPVPREPTPPPPTKKKKEPSTKFVTLDELMKEKFPMDKDPNAKPEKPAVNPSPDPALTEDTVSSKNSYAGRHQQRSQYYSRKPRAVRNKSESPTSKTPVDIPSPDNLFRATNKSVSPDRRRPRENHRKDPKGSRILVELDEKKDKTKKPMENSNSLSKTVPNKGISNPTRNVRNVSPVKTETLGNRRTPSPSKNSTKGEVKRIDSRGYYKNYKAHQILNQSMEPDILQINHDTDPVNELLEPDDPKGYQSIYQKRKHFNDFKTLPKQAV